MGYPGKPLVFTAPMVVAALGVTRVTLCAEQSGGGGGVPARGTAARAGNGGAVYGLSKLGGRAL
jgi:hypothetical protein